MSRRISIRIAVASGLSAWLAWGAAEGLAGEVPPAVRDVLEARCLGCHDGASRKGGLDLSAPEPNFADAEGFARWAKVYDRVESGEMPPKGRERPTPDESRALLGWLDRSLTDAEDARLAASGRSTLRRLTRAEYENTVRDLLDLPGAALSALLPPDGSAHGFDKNAEALSLSHVNLARYIEAADHALDLAIATRPTAPAVRKSRLSLVDRGGFDAYLSMQGDAVLLRDRKPDPEYPPAGKQRHHDQGAHEAMGSFETGSTVGVFRHEEESVSHYFRGHTTFDPGRYRVRASFWAFQWDKGQVLPARRTEAARLSVVQLTGDGRGGQHPSYTLGYYDAPSLDPTEHELVVWLNRNEIIGFDVASLAPVANYNRKGHAMAFTGPGIAVDWVDVEGPIHETWPPRSHKVLFGDLPIVEFEPERNPGVRKPSREELRWLGLGSLGKNHPDPVAGTWTVRSENPRRDADRLLAAFLPRAFRRPVAEEVRRRYVERVERRLKAGDCFETAMRSAYLAALCSPDFLHHVEPEGRLDDHALACRLSYFLWNSPPDETLGSLAASGELRRPDVLRAQAERLLADPKSRAVPRGFPRPVAQAPLDRGERPGPEALPRVQPVSARLDGRRDARLFPGTPGSGPRHQPPGPLGLRDAERGPGRPLRDLGRERPGHPPGRLAAGLPARGPADAGVDPQGHGQRDDDLARPPRRVRDRPAPGQAPGTAAGVGARGRARRPGGDDHPRATGQAPERRRAAPGATPRSTRPGSRWRAMTSSAGSGRGIARSKMATPRLGGRSTRSSGSASGSARRSTRAAPCPTAARSATSASCNPGSRTTGRSC